jgi:hypothetical protein
VTPDRATLLVQLFAALIEMRNYVTNKLLLVVKERKQWPVRYSLVLAWWQQPSSVTERH